jgi:hypothetical protein
MKNENNFTFWITQGLHYDSEKSNMSFYWRLYNNIAGAKKTRNKKQIYKL